MGVDKVLFLATRKCLPHIFFGSFAFLAYRITVGLFDKLTFQNERLYLHFEDNFT